MAKDDAEDIPMPPSPPKVGLSEALLLESEGERNDLDKIIEMLLDPANIGHLTELSKNEIIAFSALGTLSQRHPNALPVLRKFLAENLIFRVSQKRKGRGEFIRILNRAQSAQEQMQALEQRQSRWFGGRRR